MTPPPAEPIRPVGGITRDPLAVARAELHGRVVRREEPAGEDGGDGRRRRQGQHAETSGSAAPVVDSEDLAAAAGTYDDHGRPHVAHHRLEQDEPGEHPFLDRSA